ncbi:MAG: hypothetical protein FJ134_00295 [Deltaproteobacteria bacterium]|nr:hypothetical protein [Deltaproteobacteria bacterium]
MLKWLRRKEAKELNKQIDFKTFKPPDDPVFGNLLEEAVKGRVPVYFAAVPLTLVRPYDPEFHPENMPEGEKIVEAIMADWRAGRFRHLWVYPQQDYFVMADDYLTYAAALKGQPDFFPCWVLGEPRLPGVKDIQGPIRIEDVRRLLFGD